MFWRLSARLMTGPLAFFLAVVIDVVAFALQSLRTRLRGSRAGRARG